LPNRLLLLLASFLQSPLSPLAFSFLMTVYV
jgi:hypothetical protein